MSTGAAPMAPLSVRVATLLRDAADAYAGSPQETRLREAAARLQSPLRVAIAGRIKAGKSTLLNALVGERLAATDAGECTRVVTEYANGVASRAWAYPWDGEPRQVPYRREGGATVLALPPGECDLLARLRVETPNAHLERLTLVDTPGIGSVSAEVSARTADYLAGGGGATGADAVLYLLRHLHTSDVNFLEAFHDVEFRGTSPVNAIGVLSRADEVGAGQGDGLALAAGIAQRYRREPRVRSLVSTVVPVAGLLGSTAAGLRERDFGTLLDLASLPATDLLPLLLSADRFAADSGVPVKAGQVPLPIDAAARRALLSALGLYGVRLSLALIRAGDATSAAQLSAELSRRSGLPGLRTVLQTLFLERRDLLKAQAALRELSAVLASAPVPGAEVLRRRQEQVLASAHELTELRLLNELRTEEIGIDDETREEMERLLGAQGAPPAARLGLPADSPPEVVQQALLEELRRWQERSESPVLDPRMRRAAGVLRRTCEGMVAATPAPTGRRRVVVG